jgi:hypothetical protein
VDDTTLIPVRCPRCGAFFAIDPEQDTMMSGPPPGGGPDPDAPMVFRPTCPSCQQRVVVRA